MIPIFDCIDDSEPAPKGYAYAYGFDRNGNSYYGLVQVSNEIITDVLSYIVVPYRFNIQDTFAEMLTDNFFNKAINNLKQAI